MRLAVIVASYNSAANLPRCLDSILGQTAPGVGAIVVDGGSEDETEKVIERYADRLVWWCSEPDEGIYDAWNKGLARKGDAEWVCFLGADDAFCDRTVVERLFPVLNVAAPRHRLVYGEVEVTGENGELLALLSEPWERASRRIAETMSIPHTGMMHHRSLFELRGVFDTSFRIMGDYELVLREIRHSEPLHVPGLHVARWQEGGVTTRVAAALRATRERNSALAKNGFPPPSLFMRSGAQDVLRMSLRAVAGERGMRFVQRLYRRLA